LAQEPLTPATAVKGDAAEAAHDRIVLINHGAAIRLYDMLADRLRQVNSRLLVHPNSGSWRGGLAETLS
jgi:hypothetical protein